jgi:hypothetical protein
LARADPGRLEYVSSHARSEAKRGDSTTGGAVRRARRCDRRGVRQRCFVVGVVDVHARAQREVLRNKQVSTPRPERLRQGVMVRSATTGWICWNKRVSGMAAEGRHDESGHRLSRRGLGEHPQRCLDPAALVDLERAVHVSVHRRADPGEPDGACRPTRVPKGRKGRCPLTQSLHC